MSSTQISDTLSPRGLELYVHRFDEQDFELWEIIIVVTEQALDTVEQNKDRRIVLQLGIVYNPAFTKQYLKERLEKRVTNKEVKESVQDRSKNYDDTLRKSASANLSFSKKMQEELKTDHISLTAFTKRVGELWRDLPANEKTFYLAQLAEHQVTKSYRNHDQCVAELIEQGVIDSSSGHTPKLFKYEGSKRSHNQKLPEESWAWTAATGTAPRMHRGTSSIKCPYVTTPKGSMSWNPISRPAGVGRRYLWYSGPKRKRSQAGAFSTPAGNGIAFAFKDPEADKLFQRFTEVSSENDSASVVNEATEADKIFQPITEVSSEHDSASLVNQATEAASIWMPSSDLSTSNASDTVIPYTDTNRVSPSTHVRAQMDLITSEVASGFSSRASKASLTMPWDLLAFMDTQYVDNKDAYLGSVITLSGTAQYAQATTCSQYVEHNWPLRGLRVIKAFQSAIDMHKSTNQDIETDPEIHVEFTAGLCTLVVQGKDPRIIAEILQQAVWMGTALRTSTNERVQYSSFRLSTSSPQDRFFGSSFSVKFDASEVSEGKGSCWLPLFANPVIARGFAVGERKTWELGLEIPLEIMAALGGARHVTDFEGGLVLKGHSAMFVPIKRYDQSIQWHLIRRSDDQRVLYRDASEECPSRAMLDEVDYASLENTRAFLGWWKSAETYLGTADSAYDSIDWSPAGEARRSAKLAGANLGFQQMLSGQLSFVLGAKDGKLHFSQKGPFQRVVQCAEKMPVALYDTADRRAWLVPGLDVILHIVQTRHHLSPYRVGGKGIELTPAIPRKGRAAAIEAVAANQQRQLYERDVATEKSYYFQDAILDIWSQMERLMEKEDSIEACAGLALHGTFRNKLHGWEYMSLVHEKNYRRKEATIAKSSGGWVDLINDIDCLVLFATGLHEIIKPVSHLSNLCHTWRTLPKKKDFLAAGIPIMEVLFSEAGSRLSHEYLSTSHLQWHRGSILFERCSGDTSHRCKCDRTQQIYHDSLFKTFGHVQAPGTLEADGCVIFGQARHSFKLHKIIPRRQNSVPMLPNTPIENCRTNSQNVTKVDRLSSTPPLSISPEPQDVNGYAAQKAKRSPLPASFTDDLINNKIVTLKKRRKAPDLDHTQSSDSDICERDESCDDDSSSSEEYKSFPAGHRSTPKADFELPRSIELVGTVTGTRRDSTSVKERRGRQRV